MAKRKPLRCRLGMHAWDAYRYCHQYGYDIVDYCEQVRSCKECGEIEVVRIGLHQWSSWTHRVGLRERTCERCGQNQTKYDYEERPTRTAEDVRDEWGQS
jgi:hypothetical protein